MVIKEAEPSAETERIVVKIKKLKKPAEEIKQPDAATSIPAAVPEAYYSVTEEQALEIETSPSNSEFQPTRPSLEQRVIEPSSVEALEPEAPKLVPETVPKLILHLPGTEEEHKERKVRFFSHCCQFMTGPLRSEAEKGQAQA